MYLLFLDIFIIDCFKDGEISRHRFPFDYLSFLIFLSIIKKKLNEIYINLLEDKKAK